VASYEQRAEFAMYVPDNPELFELFLEYSPVAIAIVSGKN